MTRPITAPLSFAQQRLWFLQQLLPTETAYNLTNAFRLRGRLNPDHLAESLRQLIERHEILRTSFHPVAGVPVQQIAPPGPVSLTVTDLSGNAAAERQPQAHQIVIEDLHEPFDLAAAAPVRIRLIRLSSVEHMLVLTIHHILIDGWSVSLLVDELAELYAARVAGRLPTLPPLPMQYRDVARWQREQLTAERLGNVLGWWREHLLDAPTVLELPTDRPRPLVQSFAGGSHRLHIPVSRWDEVVSLAKRHRTTPFVVLLTAYAVLLSRISGQRDLVIGSPVAGRATPEQEQLIGPFSNTLPLRIDTSGDRSFVALLARVRRVVLDGLAHQDLPFEKLVEELHPDRAMSHNPLVQAMLTLQNLQPMRDEFAPGLTVAPVSIDVGTAFMDLWLLIYPPENDEFSVRLLYKSELFDRESVKRIGDGFECLLAQAVSTPETRLSQLPILPRRARAQLLTDWSTTADAYPVRPLVPELIDKQAAQTPQAVAVCFGQEVLTHAELHERANQLAHYLRDRGAGPDAIVALRLPRSAQLVVAVLAVLKSGAAYLPLEPTDPPERLDRLSAMAGAVHIVTPDTFHAVTTHPRDELAVDIAPDHLAYLIYTSGSTGAPKPVACTHRGLVNRMRWMQDRFCLGPDDRVLQKTVATFDVSVWELLWPLMTGARLIVAEPDGHRDPRYLAQVIQAEEITTIHFVPPMLAAFLEQPDLPRCGSLRRVICSGQALTDDLQCAFFSSLDAELHNLYGPTEAAIDVTAWQCDRDHLGRAVPIGRPIPGIECYVLDRYLQPTPVGVPGELYLGGVGLARGYLGLGDLTADRFVPHPWRSGARMYRTGDRVRWRPDATLEFIGRIDHQLKVRGHRIEPGEIEAALREYPIVGEAVVQGRRDRAGNVDLVGYVVPDRQHKLAQEVIERASAQTVDEWGQVFDEAYHVERRPEAADDFAGWHSSYTGSPIPEPQMREWLDRAVEQIASRRPASILDIGCGTGLFLRRLAPLCERYVGTELSTVALADLDRRITLAGLDRSRISLHQHTADGLTALLSERFDAVILNSITQYFPSADYLALVLDQAVGLLKTSGFVFIGDVRHLGLWEAFVTSVERHGSADTDSTAELRALVERALAAENELLVDPALFLTMAHHNHRIRAVDIRLKRGRGDNELNRFRYDVLIETGEPAGGDPAGTDVVPVVVRDWRRDGLTVDACVRWLGEDKPSRAVVCGIPNARVAADLRAAAALADLKAGPTTVAELSTASTMPIEESLVDPEELAVAMEEMRYRVCLRLSARGEPGRFDLVLGDVPAPQLEGPATEISAVDWHRFTNPSLRARLERELLPKLQEQLAQRLPQYMVPSRFAVLGRLPLDRHGKIDYASLPAPTLVGTADPGDQLAPRTVSEQVLAGIVAEVLGLDQVGVSDDFFGLGGDSLRSVQVCARAREAGILLTPQMVFLHPTVAELAAQAQPVSSTPETDFGTVPLTPVQQAILAVHRDGADLVELARVEVTGPLDVSILELALSIVARRHELLRCRLNGRVLTPDESEPQLLRRDAGGLAEPGCDGSAAALSGMPFHLVVEGPEDDQRLVLVVNRLMLDEYGVMLLLDELTVAYRQLLAGAAVKLPDRTIGFAAWARALADQPAFAGRSAPAPETDAAANASRDQSDLDALVEPLCEAYRMSRAELLVAAAVMALADLGHGTVWVSRRDPDAALARSVGRFDILTPLSALPASDLSATLPELKERLRGARSSSVDACGDARIVVHYQDHEPPRSGEPALLALPPSRSAAVDRLGVDVDVVLIVGSGLQVRAAGKDAEMVVARVGEVLDRLCEHSLAPDVSVYTPSDFPLAGLEQATLRSLAGSGRQIDDIYPVGPQQEWMLRRRNIRPRPGIYASYVARIGDDIDAGAWKDAWRWAYGRQATLRTALVSDGLPRPMQVVHRAAPISWHTEDWRHLPAGEQRRRLEHYLTENCFAGFELATPGHLRHAMFRVGPSRYIWAVVTDYQLFDGMAFPLLMREVHTAYQALRAGSTPQLPDPIPPADYIRWVEQQDQVANLPYWRRALAGFTRPTPLLDSLGANRSAPIDELPVRQDLQTSHATTAALRSQARRHGVTVYTLIQASWALLLHVYTGETDVLFGNVVSGRPETLPGAEQIIGYCNLHLPTRVRVEPDRSLREWLRTMQAGQVAARAHQVCSLHRIRQVGEVPADTDLYESIMTALDFPVDPRQARTWRLHRGDTTTEHPIRVIIDPDSSLGVFIAYHRAVIDHDRVRRMLDALHRVYIRMGRSLDGSVRDLAAAIHDD